MKKQSQKGKLPVSRKKARSTGPTSQSQGAVVAQSDFYQTVAKILRAARANAYRAVNFAMVEAYWNVGRTIVEEEQRGLERAKYGTALLRNLSTKLTQEFGRGFTETNLKYFRQFYLAFSADAARGIRHTLCDQLRN
jgi:hypothetical protein